MKQINVLILIITALFTASCQKQSNFQSSIEEVFPPVTLKYAALYRMDNMPISPIFFKGQWTLVTFGTQQCNESCLYRLTLINRVKGAKKLFVIDGLADHIKLRELSQKFPDVAITMGTTASSFDNFYAQFDIESIDSNKKHDQIYWVSPNAELVNYLSQNALKLSDIESELLILEKG